VPIEVVPTDKPADLDVTSARPAFIKTSTTCTRRRPE